MNKDQRKTRRRPIRYSAWMALDSDKLHGCVLSDISDTGARIDVEDAASLPDRFMLLLSGTGSARRRLPGRLARTGPGWRRLRTPLERHRGRDPRRHGGQV